MGVVSEAINEIHLKVGTEKQNYPLGFVYTAFNGGNNPSINTYVYVKAVSILIDKGDIYSISRSTSADWTATTPTGTDINTVYGVGLYPIAIGSYGFIQTMGNIAQLRVAGATTINHALTITTNDDSVTDEGSATISGSTIAIATSTGASTVSAYLFGNETNSAGGTISLNANWRITPSGNTLSFQYSTDNFATVAWTNAMVAE